MHDITGLKAVFPGPADLPEEITCPAPCYQRSYLIGGEICHWGGPVQEVRSPIWYRGESGLQPTVLGNYPLLGEQESNDALEAALDAYGNGAGEWPTMPVEKRIQCLQEFALRMTEKRDEVVNLLMWEVAKSRCDSRKEFDRTVDYIQKTIDALKDLDRSCSHFVIEEGIIAQIRRAPLGVALCMGPYNYPLNETFTTLIPALIMGNAVICKPPRLGILLHRPLLELFRDCFPPGVVNTVYGEGQKVIGPLMRSGKISLLAFIGSSRVADLLRQQHPKPHRLRCVLGLEAKNAAIILPDADLEKTVKECVLGSLSFNGQRCTALKMLFVHSDVADDFVREFAQAVENVKLGMPWENHVALTPLAELDRTEYLSGLLEDATQHGAEVVNEGGAVACKTLFNPAVVAGVTESMRLYREEQFGPLVPICTFDGIDEPIRYVRESDYGQQVSVFGRDPDAIARLIDPLVNQVCRVNLNSQCQRGPDTFPFTGRKDSAEGTLSVSDALRVFSIRTLVAARESDGNREILREIVRGRKSNFLSTDFIL
jgi:glyceraldehyde-3-phosphate dehydrogenase (NADP+)